MAQPQRHTNPFDERRARARTLIAYLRQPGVSDVEAEFLVLSALTRAYMDGLDEAVRIFDRAQVQIASEPRP